MTGYTQRNGVNFYQAYEDAIGAIRGLPVQFQATARVVYYTDGLAVEIHKSGPYVGTGLPDPIMHRCAMCGVK